MKTMVWIVLLMLWGISSQGMQNSDAGEIEELYKLCQVWFQVSEIRTIASHISEVKKRSGSRVQFPQAFQIKGALAQAIFNYQDEMVSIHKIEFPGVPAQHHVAQITFDEMVKIRALIESKNKK
ncbi:hypothetical protein BH09DEP1_BH09DEP1_3770 [soil metagenome]